jgi:hypothetical protein
MHLHFCISQSQHYLPAAKSGLSRLSIYDRVNKITPPAGNSFGVFCGHQNPVYPIQHSSISSSFFLCV